MITFTDEDILNLDVQYASENISFHARPLKAAMDILKGEFCMGVISNPVVTEICRAYERLIPEVSFTWPGMGTGLVASLDRVKTVKIGVSFGSPHIRPYEDMGFNSHAEWETWCRRDSSIVAKSLFAYADIVDLVYAINDSLSISRELQAYIYWGMSASNLEIVAHSLSRTGMPVSSIIQPICLTIELAVKGTLLLMGVAEKELKSRVLGHNLIALTERMSRERPHRSDDNIFAYVENMPDYVQTRYSSIQMTRQQIIDLALRAQFIAASATRRMVKNRDSALQLESDSWLGPRLKYFPLVSAS